MFGISQFFTFSFIFVAADAACQMNSYMPYLRFLRNDTVAEGKIFCSQETGKHLEFALARGSLPHLESVIGVYRKNQQSQVCYFKNVTDGQVDVTALTGGELYTIGNIISRDK